MQLSELRKRICLTPVATFRGDEGLIPDIRCGLRPIDCIERKLSTLLADESLNRARTISTREPDEQDCRDRAG